MKIINCGYVTYLITAHHVATIVYSIKNGQPTATIYYDGQHGEIIEATNGQTMRYAIMCARYTIKMKEYFNR